MSELVILEPAERARIVAYLEQEATSYAAMAKQMEEVNLPSMIIEREKTRAIAVIEGEERESRPWVRTRDCPMQNLGPRRWGVLLCLSPPLDGRADVGRLRKTCRPLSRRAPLTERANE